MTGLPTHSQLASYLERKGWRWVAPIIETHPWLVMRSPDGVHVRIPTVPDFGDYRQQMLEVLRVIAYVEGRPSPEGQVARDAIATSAESEAG